MKHPSFQEDQLLCLKTTTESTSPIFLPITNGTLNDFISEDSQGAAQQLVRWNKLKIQKHLCCYPDQETAVYRGVRHPHHSKLEQSQAHPVPHVQRGLQPAMCCTGPWATGQTQPPPRNRGACGQLPLATSKYSTHLQTSFRNRVVTM